MISASISLAALIAGQNISGSVTFPLTPQAHGFVLQEVSLATTATAISLGELTSPQLVYIENLDTTHYITIDGNSSFNGFPQQIGPGQGVLLSPAAGATLYGKGQTAACQALIIVV